MIENAARLTSNARERKAFAFLDAFLYSSVIGRIPRESIRHCLGWNSWKRFRNAKIDAGHWCEIAPCIRFQSSSGKLGGQAAVYAITPTYLQECLASEIERGRYASPSSLDQRKRKKPPAATVGSSGISQELAQVLLRGTGLRARLEVLARMLCHPDAFQNLSNPPSTVKAVWKMALNGWRRLVVQLPGAHLCPSWILGKNHWLYSKNPCLQTIPKLIRLAALVSLEGHPVAEVDFNACQLNIAFSLTKMGIIDSPYEHVATVLRADGLEITSGQVKKLIIPALNGQNLKHYQHRYRRGSVILPPKYFEAVLEFLLRNRLPIGDPLRTTQGQIMTRAMEILGEWTEQPGFPVHDAILLPAAFSDLAKEAMTDASIDVLGETLPCSPNYLGQYALDLIA